MPRWNNNLESNCKSVMDCSIKNIHFDLYNQLLAEVVTINLENNKKIIENYIRSKLDMKSSVAKHTNRYWISRGWSVEEAYVKSKENKRKNDKSVYSRQGWLDKINPVSGTNYTLEEADFERNSRRPIKKEYWIVRGHSEDEAIKLAIETKNQNNKKGAIQSAITPTRKVSSARCVEYYTARGFSIDEAKAKIVKSQQYFSKEICIEKYGESEGIEIWQKRQSKWQDTLNAKSDEEKSRINKLKLFKGGSISKGEALLLENIRAAGINCSGQFELLRETTNYYVYDIVYNKKIIEYNGDFWHANPKKYRPTDKVELPNNPRLAREIWKQDEQKIKFAKNQGFDVLVIWESEFKKNNKEVIKQCIQFLTQ